MKDKKIKYPQGRPPRHKVGDWVHWEHDGYIVQGKIMSVQDDWCNPMKMRVKSDCIGNHEWDLDSSTKVYRGRYYKRMYIVKEL